MVRVRQVEYNKESVELDSLVLSAGDSESRFAQSMSCQNTPVDTK